MTEAPLSSTQRFSDRVSDYARYRPSYPDSLVDWLIDRYSVNNDSSIADIGSGTGVFTRLLIDKGLSVIAVEPNNEMRMESDRVLENSPLYNSVSGTAEKTTLADESINFLVAAQAFHWFDVSSARQEFRRILSPGGVAALIWNRRLTESTFQLAYEKLLAQLLGYNEVKHTRFTDKQISNFIGSSCEKSEFSYSQTLDLASFKGRVFSSSYTPKPTDGGYAKFVDNLEDLFVAYSKNGLVTFDYSSTVFSGCLE